MLSTSGMADSTKTKASGGCLSKFVALFGFLLVCGITAAAVLICQPQDLSDIGGYGPATADRPVRDLKYVLQRAIERRQPLSLTEMEINQWLGRTLVAKQGGLLAGQVSLNRVWVRLEDGRAELITERSIMGKPFTLSMYLNVEQTQSKESLKTEVHMHGGPYHPLLPKPPRGGRFGRLVVPQGFLILVLPAYERLAEIYRTELQMAFRGADKIRIERNRLVLEPSPPSQPAGAHPAGS